MTQPNTQSNTDEELEKAIDTILKEFADNVLLSLEPSVSDDVMLTNPTTAIVQIIKNREAALLSRIKEEADDHHNGFGKVVTVESIDTIKAEIEGSTE